ncbi:MAG TPA: bifunctional riboflavin kinase/FAD synthetase, partial [Actinocrinis sp.]|uniref:bifunctional riboflavin kinase/FAD synthetase n=1 Tax=Actinocrinis sp. TaxID=1920516 RepID=UPI002DDD4314
MERWHGLAELPPGWGAPGGCVVTVGFFDGVHLGHQAVVRRAVALAGARGASAVVLTFDPHPSEVLRPGTHPPLLSTPAHRVDLMEKLGVDAVLVLPFTTELSLLTPEEFVRQVLVERLHAVAVVVGENFRFGHRAAGTLDTLTELGEKYGFTAEGLPLAAPEDSGGQRFSSTDVRKMVLAGEVETAALRLGRPHRVEGVVVRGAQRGRELGFPTANVDTPPHTAIPADGVYAGWLVVDGDPLPAAISIGTNPTF